MKICRRCYLEASNFKFFSFRKYGMKTNIFLQAVDKILDQVPAFSDIFDEETFYTFAAVFTALTCLAGFIASRYISLKQRD